ncbi:hypothetical protein ACFOEY_05270 [Paracandidimonas soli]|uniref:hypothetical protein n=1 Tax=Paracandidimonas soli TaxID=1917182 RepID=UPI00361B1985
MGNSTKKYPERATLALRREFFAPGCAATDGKRSAPVPAEAPGGAANIVDWRRQACCLS